MATRAVPASTIDGGTWVTQRALRLQIAAAAQTATAAGARTGVGWPMRWLARTATLCWTLWPLLSITWAWPLAVFAVLAKEVPKVGLQQRVQQQHQNKPVLRVHRHMQAVAVLELIIRCKVTHPFAKVGQADGRKRRSPGWSPGWCVCN